MSLHLYLFRWEDGLLSVPIVFQRHIVHNNYSVQLNRYLFAYHLNIEGIPFAQFVVLNA